MATTKIRRDLCMGAVAQALGLALVGWHFRHALNSDGVAYLRLGSYWSSGKWGLAVSGYWGPLLSWVVAALIKAGLPILAAGRVAMALSAVVFYWGCVAVYRALEVPAEWMRLGAWAAALASVYWSVHFITPDLLVAGLIGFAAAQMLQTDGQRKVRCQWAAGGLWGVAYLAKAIAFPLGVLFILLTAVYAVFHRAADRRKVQRCVGMTLLAFGLVAAPWVTVISLKYKTPMFSSSARINYAIAGPPDQVRYHPSTRTFHQPDDGRVTSWEDPSSMTYQKWRPWESEGYLIYQLRFILRNAGVCLWLLTTLNLLWPAMAAEWLVVVMSGRKRMPSPSSIDPEGWIRRLGLVGLLGLLYLPFVIGLTE